jgi:hypothetical protein
VTECGILSGEGILDPICKVVPLIASFGVLPAFESIYSPESKYLRSYAWGKVSFGKGGICRVGTWNFWPKRLFLAGSFP